jgi:CheY-like chemotaxis protein
LHALTGLGIPIKPLISVFRSFLPVPENGRIRSNGFEHAIFELPSTEVTEEGRRVLLASRKPTLLVVDDERSVRDLIRLQMESEGFEVHTAVGGKDAIRIASDPEIAIDIVITDILMPHMNGKELANRISSLKPFIKVLFVTAYSAELLTSHKLCPDGADFIKKPFTKEILLERISRMWASSPTWSDLVAKPR